MLALASVAQRLPGGGYPDGLAGEAIPFYARVVAIVDACDAMTKDRPYWETLPADEVFRRMEREAGGNSPPCPPLVRLAG